MKRTEVANRIRETDGANRAASNLSTQPRNAVLVAYAGSLSQIHDLVVQGLQGASGGAAVG